MDFRQKSTSELDVNTNALPVSGPQPGPQQSSTRQLPFSANAVFSQASDYQATPVLTHQVPNTPEISPPVSDPGLPPTTTQALLNPVPAVTRQLSETQTDAFASLPVRTTTALRQPVLIRGTGKKSLSPRPPRGRRLVVHAAVAYSQCRRAGHRAAHL
jgi:hypothetical protein